MSALTNKLSIQVPEYKISSDQLLQLATPLGKDDQKPSTPIADFVPVSDSKNLTGKRFKLLFIPFNILGRNALCQAYESGK